MSLFGLGRRKRITPFKTETHYLESDRSKLISKKLLMLPFLKDTKVSRFKNTLTVLKGAVDMLLMFSNDNKVIQELALS